MRNAVIIWQDAEAHRWATVAEPGVVLSDLDHLHRLRQLLPCVLHLRPGKSPVMTAQVSLLERCVNERS